MPRLADLSTRAPRDLDKQTVKQETLELLDQLDELQNRLYAGGEHAVLVILQGMDASGKDGAVKKVFGRLNPMGVHVTSFKVPTEEEKSHDFLWRIHRNTPPRGMIHVFNRSQYEDVLVTRVHNLIDDDTARRRFKAINQFEQMLARHNNTLIYKFYLHISPEEQEKRFQERIDDPAKHWKFNPADKKEAAHWDRYREMYEDVFEHCSDIPWQIVPADQNWYKEHLIARALVDGLSALKLEYPEPKIEKEEEK